MGWSLARGQTTSFTRGTGSTVDSAVGAFAAAISSAGHGGNGGGAGGGARALASSVRAGQSLGAVLRGVASAGLDNTLRTIGLGHLVGETPAVVLSALAGYICGNGGLLDDGIARNAMVEVLATIFDISSSEYEEFRDGWNAQVDQDSFCDLMTLFIAESIFQRFISELGNCIETNAVSVAEAEAKEKDVYEFIRAMVTFELGEIDPLHFDWQGPPGGQLIRRNVNAALRQLQITRQL